MLRGGGGEGGMDMSGIGFFSLSYFQQVLTLFCIFKKLCGQQFCFFTKAVKTPRILFIIWKECQKNEVVKPKCIRSYALNA